MKRKRIQRKKIDHSKIEENELGLIPEEKAAPLIEVLPWTMKVWRSRFPEKAPPYVKIGRNIFYRKEDLIEWIKRKTVQPPQTPVEVA